MLQMIAFMLKIKELMALLKELPTPLQENNCFEKKDKKLNENSVLLTLKCNTLK